MRVAVLTSGGDSAGMNAAVRAVVKQAIVRYHCLFPSVASNCLSTRKGAVKLILFARDMKVLLEEISILEHLALTKVSLRRPGENMMA